MKRSVWIGVATVILAAVVGAGLVLMARGTSGVVVSHGPEAGAASTNDSDACPHTPPTVSPEYSPPEVSDPALKKLVDRRAMFDERVPANITSLIPAVKDGKDVAALVQVLSDPAEPDTVRHEVANLLRRSEYAGLEETLVKREAAGGKRKAGREEARESSRIDANEYPD